MSKSSAYKCVNGIMAEAYTPRLNKTVLLYIHSSVWQMLTDFQNFLTVVFAMKFATQSISYISPYFKGVTPLPCKTQKTESGKILLHVTQ